MRSLDDIRQMCDGPSDGWTQGEWCDAANHAVFIADRLRERGFVLAAAAAELARWSRVAESNGSLHARLASALALFDEAAEA